MTGLLSGVTILELGQVIAGNFGGVVLADLGAEVIKIEPHTGDTARNANIAPLRDESSIHLFMNRGKKSVVLDLKVSRGLEIFYSLVEQADVVLDNFRPGVMNRLGIDHESLKRRNPDIITVSITGFGEYGPARDKATFDLADVFLTKSNEEWLVILDEFDIPSAPVNDIAHVFDDAQVQARGMIQTYDHPTIGPVRYPPSPVKFSDWNGPNEPAPMLGQHTAAVLTHRLGLGEPEVSALADAGVVKLWPDQS